MLRRHFMINTDSGISNNEIWYTSSDNNILTPTNVESLPTIISNTYSNGKGVIKFIRNVTSIGDEAFKNCKSLTSITVPNSVTYIGEGVFEGTRLYENQSNWENGVLYISNYIIIKAEKNISGAYKIKEGTRLIANAAFNGCTSLTSVAIPNSVTYIGYDAFYQCSSLTSVHITNLAAWCNIDFSNNSANPLWDANNLYLNGELVKDLVIPNNVTSIRDCVFYHCTSLISVIIPNSVISIGYSAFASCTTLTSITFEGTIEEWNSITKPTNWNLNVPATVVHCTDGDVEI